MTNDEPIPLGEFCRRIGAESRHARYVLEEGILPAGVDPQPGHGNHRRLTPGQAFWLAIVLKLKASAVRTPLAARVADYASDSVRTVARQLGWDPDFAPFDGRLATERRWYVEVGDLIWIRLVTDANPSGGGRVEEFEWSAIGGGEMKMGRDAVTPSVVIRVDLARIAAMLRA